MLKKTSLIMSLSLFALGAFASVQLEPGSYHQEDDQSELSKICSVYVQHHSDTNSISVVKISNQKTRLKCYEGNSEASVYSCKIDSSSNLVKCGDLNGENNKVRLVILDSNHFIFDNIKYEFINANILKPLTFVATEGIGYSWYNSDRNCKMDSGESKRCSDITRDEIKENLCPDAQVITADKAMEGCSSYYKNSLCEEIHNVFKIIYEEGTRGCVSTSYVKVVL